MPRTCTVCQHEGRDEIDRALVSGESSYALADRYSSLSRPAIQRHRENHLPTRLVLAEKAAEVAQADNLLDQVRDLQGRALAILDKAEATGELRTALSAIREARGNLELLAKLLGELSETPQVNLTVSPEWLELRTTIITALDPHPQARESVLRALESTANG